MLYSYSKKIITLLFIFTFTLNAYAKETLVFAFDLIRHGDRTPLMMIPSSPHTWPEGAEQLTARGMRQELQRGEILRKRYMEQYHLLSPHFQNETMYVYSTDFDRTLMSAQSILLGLYSLGSGPRISTKQPALPVLFQPIPIHTQPKNSDPILSDIFSPQYTQQLNRYVASQPIWIQKTNALQNKNKFTTWSQATGLTLTTIHDLGFLADTLHIYQIHRIPLPKELSETDAKELIKIGLWGYVYEYQSKEIANIVGNPLLFKIADYIDDASQNKTPLKYVLFVAHDITIMSLMTTLGAPLNKQPPYTSDLNVSLFKSDQEKYIVKITYNDKPVYIPYCEATTCTLEQFLKLAGH